VVLGAIIVTSRVDDGVPDVPIIRVREREVDRLRSGVEQQQEVIVEDAASACAGVRAGRCPLSAAKRAGWGELGGGKAFIVY